jgi:hypothetical protein
LNNLFAAARSSEINSVKRFSLLLHYSDVSENGSSKVAAKKPETEFSFRLDRRA